MIHKITAITLLLFAIIQADTLTLRAGLNGFGGLIDASIHNPHGGAKLGGVWPQAGSSWCWHTGDARGVIEFSLDQIDPNREIESVELAIWRYKFSDEVGDEYRENAGLGPDDVVSNVRELCRTSFIDIDETYAVWYPSSWGTLDNAIGDIVDTFDSEDNFTPGWETYDITEVVKDSLGTERNKVNFVLKLRDETKSYNRLVRYYGDVETDTVDLSNYTDERIELFPTVTVVYRTPVSINETSKIRSNFTGPGSVKVFSANGRLLREVTISSNTSNALLLESLGLTQGVYVIQKKVGGVVQTGKCAIR